MGTVDRYFRDQQRFIERCEDAEALLGLMGEYRLERRTALAEGRDELCPRLDDLLERAEDRVADLKAHKLREQRARRERRQQRTGHREAPRPPAQRQTPVREGPVPTVAQPRPPTSTPQHDTRLQRLRAELEEERAVRQRADQQRQAAQQTAERQRQEAERIARERRAAQARATEERRVADELAELRR